MAIARCGQVASKLVASGQPASTTTTTVATTECTCSPSLQLLSRRTDACSVVPEEGAGHRVVVLMGETGVVPAAKGGRRIISCRISVGSALATRRHRATMSRANVVLLLPQAWKHSQAVRSCRAVRQSAGDNRLRPMEA
eukprot:COSAG02_NODE_5244_length_4508_cov_42.946700_2_plen_139_part_00